MQGTGPEPEGEDAFVERVQGRETGADDGDVIFEGGPDCGLGVFLCKVAAAQHGGELVETGGAGGDDEDAEAEDEDDACFLFAGEVQAGEEGHGEEQDDDVCEDLDGCVRVPDWSFGETVLRAVCAVDGPEVADWDTEDEAAYDHPQAGGDEGAHCYVGCDSEGAVLEDADEEDQGG